MKSQPEYTYRPKGALWAVYHWEYYPDGGAIGTKVAEFQAREDARRECYRLNGWKYTEK